MPIRRRQRERPEIQRRLNKASSPRGCCHPQRRPLHGAFDREQASIPDRPAGSQQPRFGEHTVSASSVGLCRVSAFLWACPRGTFRSALSWTPPWERPGALLYLPAGSRRLGHPVDYDLTFGPFPLRRGNSEQRQPIRGSTDGQCTVLNAYHSCRARHHQLIKGLRGRSSQARDLAPSIDDGYSLSCDTVKAPAHFESWSMSAAHHFRSA